jgi:hypothetical protein
MGLAFVTAGWLMMIFSFGPLDHWAWIVILYLITDTQVCEIYGMTQDEVEHSSLNSNQTKACNQNTKRTHELTPCQNFLKRPFWHAHRLRPAASSYMIEILDLSS